jgi:hypothetical protein
MLRLLLVGCIATATAIAQSPLTTTFANNNSGSIGGGVYFDVNVTNPAGITIAALDLNVTGTGSVDVYTIAGTRVGNQTNQPAWTLVSSGTVNNAAFGGPTWIDLAPFALAPGTYGMALAGVGVGHAYTNGNGFNQSYSNADLGVACGEATNVAFSGSLFTPRVVNARFYYAIGSQIGLPVHASTYNGFSRGFSFTAQTDMVINQLSLPGNAFQAGDTASYLVRVNGATALRSVGNAGAIATEIVVNSGDAVDIIGNWSPAAPGNFTAHNSYGNTAPYATTIAGVAHTLSRSGWQWDIGDPTWVDTGATGTFLTPTTGALGRVFVSASAGGLGTNTPTGSACNPRFASFYELMTAAAFDLDNTAITLIPVGGGYRVVAGGSLLAVGSTSTPTNLALTDDSQVTVAFTSGSFPGWTGVTVCSNGFVSKASGNGTSFTPAVATMLGAAQDAFWSWHDYNPAAPGSGAVKYEESAARIVITWDGVFDFAAATPNTLQFQLDPSGNVVIAWGNISGNGNAHLVGYSPGGANDDPGPSDISAIGAGSILLTPSDLPALTVGALNRPLIGGQWLLEVSNVQPSAVLGVDVIGLSDPNIPDLFFLGAPGCGLRASLDVLNAWLPTGPTHNHNLAIPANLALVDLHVYTTSALWLVPQPNALGAVTANGLDGKVGNQ